MSALIAETETHISQDVITPAGDVRLSGELIV
jgi:hypothetical protein